MSNSHHILSTRKMISGKIFELHARGCKITSYDFIRKVIHIPSDLNPQAIQSYVVLTSSTGVKSFLEITKQLHLDKNTFTFYCLSSATQDLAANCGLNIKSSAPNASLLADEIIKDAEVKTVTHISSNLTRPELSEKLGKAGIAVQQVVGYHTAFTPMVIRNAYDGIIFFSPSAVDSFLSINPLTPMLCFCIGKTTADHAKKKGYQQIHVAKAPTEVSLLETILNYYSQSPVHAKK